MRVLFIGGTGNISTSVSKLCVERGIDLFLLNRGTRKTDITGITKITGDINSNDIYQKLKKHNWDVVVNWIAFTPKDIERDIKLFSNKIKQYIFISSASVYQKPPLHPIITESTPLYNPFWDYSQNKIACEEKLMQAYRNEHFPITIVRPSYTYDTIIPLPFGSGSEYTIIDRIKKGQKVIVHGDGTSLWVMTHSSDFAKGFVGLIGHQQAIGNAFHITSDELLTWNQIFEAIGNAVGHRVKIVHISSDFLCSYDKSFTGPLLGDKSYSVIFDNSKIKTYVPDYCATVPFSEGIKRTLDWFEEKPERMIIKKETNKWIDGIIKSYE